MKSLFILRASHVAPDPRVERAAHVAQEHGLPVEVLAWDRDADLPSHETAAFGLVRRLRYEAAHGRGLANLLGLVVFQLYLLSTLLRSARRVRAIHACDLSTGIAGLVAARLLRVPLIYDIFDYYIDAFPVPARARPFVKRIETWVINHADEVILPTDPRRTQILPARPRRLTIVENSPDIERVEIDDLSPTDLAYVGILTSGRLLEEIVDAIAANPEITFRIAGFGPLEHHIADVASRSPNIEYVGQVDVRGALSILSAGQVMFATYDPIIPNHRFSAPNKYGEALALGKPLIVCHNTSVDELVVASGYGRAINYDVAEFVAALKDILSDEAFKASCAKGGPEEFATRHSWTVNKARLGELYDRVLAESR